MNSPLVRRFERNKTGRDYVVGDVHGCFPRLERLMRDAGFDKTRDRLFSVGDLVDRGPESERVMEWLAQPWFFAVRGNHEQMAIGVAAGRHDRDNYFINGGGWFLALQDEDKELIAAALDRLPVCIEVDTPNGLVGIVHAEIEGTSWPAFLEALETAPSKNKRRDLLETALWCRDRVRVGDCTPVEGVAKLYVGHTPMKEWAILGNVHYIDTGACFGRKLTMIDLMDGDVYEV